MKTFIFPTLEEAKICLQELRDIYLTSVIKKINVRMGDDITTTGESYSISNIEAKRDSGVFTLIAQIVPCNAAGEIYMLTGELILERINYIYLSDIYPINNNGDIYAVIENRN
jgi:hypothetical protein